jgi:hypothetical protein
MNHFIKVLRFEGRGDQVAGNQVIRGIGELEIGDMKKSRVKYSGIIQHVNHCCKIHSDEAL